MQARAIVDDLVTNIVVAALLVLKEKALSNVLANVGLHGPALAAATSSVLSANRLPQSDLRCRAKRKGVMEEGGQIFP